MSGSAMARLFDTGAGAVLQERLFDAVDPAAWDRFVIASGGSFLGCWKVIAAEGLARPIRIFELYAPDTEGRAKIAQCALAVAHGRARFLDRLHVLPAHAHRWEAALRAVIARCGAARVRYGSFWNHEQPCLAAAFGPAFGPAPGPRLVHTPFGIDRVAFADWGDFAAYRRGISENVRRDYKKAATSNPMVITRRGLAAVRDVPGLVGLRREVMRRNAEPFSTIADGPRHLMKLVAMGDDAFIMTLTAEGALQVSFFGVRFGDALYYLGGGTRDRSQGYGSYLFLTLIEQWFAEHPRGGLYLGENLPNVDPRTYTTGNLLYRRKLRAEVIPGTMFTLDTR
jgi:hypothetical protein